MWILYAFSIFQLTAILLLCILTVQIVALYTHAETAIDTDTNIVTNKRWKKREQVITKISIYMCKHKLERVLLGWFDKILSEKKLKKLHGVSPIFIRAIWFLNLSRLISPISCLGTVSIRKENMKERDNYRLKLWIYFYKGFYLKVKQMSKSLKYLECAETMNRKLEFSPAIYWIVRFEHFEVWSSYFE